MKLHQFISTMVITGLGFMMINPFLQTLSPVWSSSQWASYILAIDSEGSLFNALLYSLKISILGTITSCMFCSLVAYALAVYRFTLRTTILIILLIILMIPESVKVVPFFITLKQFDLIGTHFALWIPFTVPALGVFIIKQYAESVLNSEVLSAARLEGANEWDVFFKVSLPLLMPAISIVAIIQFAYLWNSYELSVIVISEETQKPLSHAVQTGFEGAMAPISYALLIFVPVMILVCCSRYISRFIESGINQSIQ